MPLTQLTSADLVAFLTDDEKSKFYSDMKKTIEGLGTCPNIRDGGSLDPLTSVELGLNVAKFQVDSWGSMHNIGLLLKKVYQLKVAKAKEEERKRAEEEKCKKEEAEAEQKRKEEQDQQQAEQAEKEREKIESKKRWDAAYKALNIPATDATTYLKPEEQKKFADSILGAVDAYLDKKESYILDSRAGNYLFWINVINKKKEEKRQKTMANLAAREFNDSLSKHIAGLKSKLNNRPRNLQNYFTAGIQDKRYTGHNFDYILDDEQERIFDATLVRVANDKLKQIIPPDLLEFIEIPSTYYRLYFPLPSLGYSFAGVPCLDFVFDIFATAYAEVLLKPKVKKFGIWSFNLPAEKEGNILVPLEEPKLLGYFHILLTPEDLGGYVPWETIPLVLLNWLCKGGTKPPGITISAASDGMIAYKISKFKDEVNLLDVFSDYLRDTGDIDKLLSKANATEKVASIVRAELGELKVGGKASLSEEKLKRKDSKKGQAFSLFDEGESPSSPRVKALGLNYKVCRNYYALWKKEHKS